jgi:hypothetical protein
MDDRTTPSRETREAEREEAGAAHDADRPPTTEEAAAAQEHDADPDTATHYEEMAERGADQRGEGRI